MIVGLCDKNKCLTKNGLKMKSRTNVCEKDGYNRVKLYSIKIKKLKNFCICEFIGIWGEKILTEKRNILKLIKKI